MDGRNLVVLPFVRPVIQAVISQKGKDGAILIDEDLTLTGHFLNSNLTVVRIGNAELHPQKVTSKQIRVSLNHPLVRAGDHDIWVIHQLMLGRPPTPHYGPDSNRVKIKLRGKILGNIGVSGSSTNGQGLISAILSVKLKPTVSKDQQVSLFLNELDSLQPASHHFKAPERIQDVDEIEFPVNHVRPGNYLVRVQIDGADTLLSMTEGQYRNPSVSL